MRMVLSLLYHGFCYYLPYPHTRYQATLKAPCCWGAANELCHTPLNELLQVDKLRVQGGGGIKYLKLDGIYAVNSYKNMQLWNDSGLHIVGLKKGEVVHAVHLDTNINVTDSAAGQVLVGFIAESVR
jgi:hypothetical protein